MRRILRELTRPAMLVALLALGMASVGTAFASGLIGSAQVRDNSLTSADIHDDGIQSRDIKNLSLGTADLAEGSVTSTKIKNGTIRFGDLASDSVRRSQVADGEITASAIAPSAIKAAAIADGAVGARSLDPRLARVYQFGGGIATGAPDRMLLEQDGYRYSLRCTDDGGGERTASLVVSRVDGGTAWGYGGTQSFIYPTVGDVTYPVANGNAAEAVFSAATGANYGSKVDIYVANNAPLTTGQQVSAIVANTPGGASTGCAVGGTVTPLDLV